MLAERDEMLALVFLEYSKLASAFYSKRKWNEMTEDELWNELVLCILSSNVPYDLARSAFIHLMRRGYLKLDWITGSHCSQLVIADELSKPIYSPRRINGSWRKYRFHSTRARNIVQSAKIVSSKRDWLTRVLASSRSESDTREALVNNLYGIGLKEASHYLRNIRYSHQLAIIDSHIISFLEMLGVITNNEKKTICKRIYLILEDKLRQICEEFELDLSVFDMAVWHCMRRRRPGCESL